MGKTIEVLFKQTKKGAFQIGQRKWVRAGYARNYLFPFDLAVEYSDKNQVVNGDIEKKAQAKQAELKGIAETVQKAIHEQTLTFKAKSHDGGKLFGSVAIQDILSELNRNHEVTLDKYDIDLRTPIKQAGDYLVPVVIHPEVKIVLNVTVIGEEEKKKVSKYASRAELASEQEKTADQESEKETSAAVETETEQSEAKQVEEKVAVEEKKKAGKPAPENKKDTVKPKPRKQLT